MRLSTWLTAARIALAVALVLFVLVPELTRASPTASSAQIALTP
jgi:hypothetical protein